MATRVAPGPSGSWLLGNLVAFRHDVLALALEASRTYGDVVRFRLGTRVVHLINNPDHIHYVLQLNRRNFERRARSAQAIAAVCGDSLLTSSGDVWARQRQLVQPAFHPQCLAAFTPLMIDATSAMLARWDDQIRGDRSLQIDEEMSRLTFTIVANALFGADVADDAERVAAALGVLLEETYRRLGRVLDMPGWLLVGANRRFEEACDALDAVVYRIIADCGRASSQGHLLARLSQQAGESTAEPPTDRQLRDHVITLLLAGHETTANALAWTFYLLSQHPDVEERLCAELTTVLNGRAPAIADLQDLPITETVLSESLRLYPPIWILERLVLEDDEIGGFHIPAGSTVVVSPYTLHRHPLFWPSADDFVPARFSDAQSHARPTSAFMPFGAGPHSCIGSQFALIEARIVIAMVMQAFRLRLVPGHHVAPRGGITLRFRNGLRMGADRRASMVSGHMPPP